MDDQFEGYNPDMESKAITWPDLPRNQISEFSTPADIVMCSQSRLTKSINLLRSLQLNLNDVISNGNLSPAFVALVTSFKIVLSEAIDHSELENILFSNYTALHMMKEQNLVVAHTKFGSFDSTYSIVRAFRTHISKGHGHNFYMMGDCNYCFSPRNAFKRRTSKCKFLCEVAPENQCFCVSNEPFPICSDCAENAFVGNLSNNSSVPLSDQIVCLCVCPICHKTTCPFDLLLSDGRRVISEDSDDDSMVTSVSPAYKPRTKTRNENKTKGKKGTVSKCKSCGQAGHYTPTCPNAPPIQKVEAQDNISTHQMNFPFFNEHPELEDFPPIMMDQ